MLTAASVWICFRMVRPPGTRPLPSYVQAVVLLLSFRPILSDLHHGNNNLVILFLVVASLYAWRKGYDVLAGLILALAISYKVTPALFLPYFAYKRSWRTVGATFLGMGVFLLIVPSLFLGPQFNGECLAMWWQRMISPFLAKGEGSPQEVNQSMVGVLTRLLTDTKLGNGRYDAHMDVNLVSLPRPFVGLLLKVLSFGLVGTAGPVLPDQNRAAGRPSAARRVRPDRPDDALHLGAELEASLRDLALALHLSDLSRIPGPRVAGCPSHPGNRDGAFCASDGDDLERIRGVVRRGPGPQDRPGLRHVPLGGCCAL